MFHKPHDSPAALSGAAGASSYCAQASLPSWKSDTTLADLAPDETIEIRPKGRPPIWATPRELMREGRLPAFLTLDQVEFAFSA